MKIKQPVREREAIEAPRLAWPLRQAAHRIGVSRGLLYKLEKAGKIKLTRIAGRTVILDAEINRLMAGESAGAA